MNFAKQIIDLPLNSYFIVASKVVPNSFLSSVLPEFPGIFPGVPGNGT